MAPTDPVVIGRDTRASSPDFADALIAGFSAAGVPSRDMGVVPTPAVAWAAARGHTLGAMVSASHNPWYDNGVKLFGPGGGKLDDDTQTALESALADSSHLPAPDRGGPRLVTGASELVVEYEAVVVGTADFDGSGLHAVVDAAHGSATAVLPGSLRAHGVAVTVINDAPDGRNINQDCGSTCPETVARAVRDLGADLGLTFDGDADRVLAVDHTGRLVDGDQIIAICAIDRHRRGRLLGNTVVVTVMTNLGFHRAMAERGIDVVTTPVGDRHVLAALQEAGWALGGEQSGHVIFPNLAGTGDGLLTAMQLLEVVARRNLPLSDLSDEAMTKLPQVLKNVTLGGKPVDERKLSAAIASAEETLGSQGRVLVRPSGTEPVIRVMVEAESVELAETVASGIASAISG